MFCLHGIVGIASSFSVINFDQFNSSATNTVYFVSGSCFYTMDCEACIRVHIRFISRLFFFTTLQPCLILSYPFPDSKIDNIPLFRYRRRPYLLVSLIFGAVCTLAMSLFAYSYKTMLFWGVSQAVFFAFAEVILDSITVSLRICLFSLSSPSTVVCVGCMAILNL